MSIQQSYDVVIAGGAVTGSSLAYHLAANPDFKGRILVVEKDPSYSKCASALSAGSIRQQFSTSVNIAISLYGIAFMRTMAEVLETEHGRPDIQLHEGGYLFLATPEGEPILRANHALQAELGADIILMDRAALNAKFPWLQASDLAAGCWGRSGEGWFDGYALMQAFRSKARALGVEYLADEVLGVDRAGGKVEAVRLKSGARIGCGALVNAAGIGAAKLAAAAGLTIPIHPKKRMIFMFDCKEKLESFPLLIEPNGVYARPEGEGFICGCAPAPDNDPDSWSFEVDYELFEETIWPSLAERVPAFESIKLRSSWSCHYDMNLFDYNVFLGPPEALPNFYLANGFSGHGLQQSPAIGRGLSELITYGGYRTLDLTPLNFARFERGEKLLERNVV
jgi:FAD-dependent oxidoreductase domain-containing protein 1